MQSEFFIVQPINDTDYRFEIHVNKEDLFQYFVTISFFSSEQEWVMVFEREEMYYELGAWHFKCRKLPEAILQKEILISEFIVKQIITI